MSSYALVDDGVVAEIIASNETPIAERFHPEIVATLAEIPSGVAVETGWTWDGAAFSPPAPPAPVVPNSVPAWAAQGVLAVHGRYDEAKAACTAAGGFWPFRFNAPTWMRADMLAIGGQMTPALSAADVDGMLADAAAAAAG